MYKEMTTSQILTGRGENRSYEHELNNSSPGNSIWVLIPDKINIISVTLSFTGGGSGKMQTSTDKVDTVKNGSPEYKNWPFGEVSASRQERCDPCTAIRLEQINAGTMKVSVRAQ